MICLSDAAPVSAEAVIKSLRSMIPTFQCLENCVSCCGPVPFAKWEWAQVTDRRVATCLDCPYAQAVGGCAIYDDRPIMCHLFGAVDDPMLTCPHGCGPLIKLTAQEGRAILDAYIAVQEMA